MSTPSDLVMLVRHAKAEALRALATRQEPIPVGFVLKPDHSVESFRPQEAVPMLALVEVIKHLKSAVATEHAAAVAYFNPLPDPAASRTSLEVVELYAESSASVTSETIGFRKRLLLGWHEAHSSRFPHAEHRFYVS
jgi:hypothetical protein